MLYFIGLGSFVAGVPARDLTEEEVEEYGGKEFLLSTQLYTTIKPDELHVEFSKARRSKIAKEDK